MNNGVPKPEVQSVVDAIRRIVRILRVSARAAEREAGLSGAQLFVLQKLADGPVSSLGELAARTLTDQSSVSVVVSRLVDHGLVSRSTSRLDARRTELSLTRAGRAMLRRMPEPAQERLIGALERLPPMKLRTLARGLDALVREMGAAEEAATLFFEEPANGKPSR